MKFDYLSPCFLGFKHLRSSKEYRWSWKLNPPFLSQQGSWKPVDACHCPPSNGSMKLMFKGQDTCPVNHEFGKAVICDVTVVVEMTLAFMTNFE